MRDKRNNKQKDILFIFISSFIVVAAWIGFNLYHIWATTTVSEDLQVELTPIAPAFDSQTMGQLKTRENINPIFENTATPSATPTPVQLAIPTAAPVVQQTPTPAPSIIPSTIPSGAPSQTPSGTPVVSPSNSPINRLGQ